MSSHLGLSIIALMTCSKTLECDQLKTANTKLTEELAQVKEKYTSQLKDGVRIKTEVGAAWEGVRVESFVKFAVVYCAYSHTYKCTCTCCAELHYLCV